MATFCWKDSLIHQKLNGTLTNGPRLVSCDSSLLDTQVFSSVRSWVPLEISWILLNSQTWGNNKNMPHEVTHK